jgi:hypothetical protein
LEGVADEEVAVFDCPDARDDVLEEGRLLVVFTHAVPCEMGAAHGRHVGAQLESFFT